MTDSLVTIRPSGVIGGGASYTATGAGSLTAAVNDNSDSSYITLTGALVTLAFDLDDPSLPALSLIRFVQFRARTSDSSPNVNHPLLLGPFDPANPNTGNDVHLFPTPSIVTYAGPIKMTTDTGASWTPALIAALGVEVILEGATMRVYELYCDVTYNQAPTATVTAPSGTVTATSRPTVTWTYADAESDAQERYWVKVFSAAQYGAAGFDPTTSTPAWGSGEVFSAATSAVVGLIPNGIYRAYVKVADVGSSGRYGPWAYSSFTEAAALVTPPAVVAAVDEPGGRVTLTLTGTDARTDTAAVQRSTDGGVTWAAPARLWTDPTVLWDGTLAATATVVVYDYESPLWGPVQYRADATQNPGVTGPWSAPVTVLGRSPDTWLKDPLDPTANLLLCDNLDVFATTSTEPQQVLAALGDPDYDVNGDVARGETFTLAASFATRSGWAAFDALRRTRRKLFLSTYDEAWYVRLGPDRQTTVYPPDPETGERLRLVTVGARQVKAP